MVKKENWTDVNPQFFTDYITMSAANTYTSKQLAMPINPGATITGNKVRVMEFLKVLVETNPDTLAEDAAVALQLTYKEQGSLLTYIDAAKWVFKAQLRFQLITSGAIVTLNPITIDLTDGAGNGLLIGNQFLYLGMVSTGQAASCVSSIKVLYRFKDVSIQEYVGMVQGQ